MRRIVFIVTAITLALTGCGPEAENQVVKDSRQAAASKSAAPAVTTPAPPPVREPVPADFQISLKVKDKECYGEAGCNITASVRLGWSTTLPEGKTYDVTYEIRNVEDSPVIGTISGVSDDGTYDEPWGDEVLSTARKSQTPKIVVTQVEES